MSLGNVERTNNRKTGLAGLRHVPLLMLAKLIVSGLLLSSCSVVTKLIPGSGGTTTDSQSDKDISMPQRWIKDTPAPLDALDEAVEKLFKYIDSDRVLFESLFAERLRKEDTFQGFVDDFLKACPKGFSNCTIPKLIGHEEKNTSDNQYRYNMFCEFQVELNHETYFCSILICIKDKTNPENVGVNEFRVMNQGGWARYYADMIDVIQNSSGKIKKNTYTVGDRTYNYLQCFCSDEPLRMIDNSPQLWHETDYQIMTIDEMTAALKECKSTTDLTRKIGAPNSDTYEGYSYYEVKSDNGSPLYVVISSDKVYNFIYDAYKCDAEKIYYDEGPIVDKR